jgi:hypothetical protein
VYCGTKVHSTFAASTTSSSLCDDEVGQSPLSIGRRTYSNVSLPRRLKFCVSSERVSKKIVRGDSSTEASSMRNMFIAIAVSNLHSPLQ